MSTTAAVKKEFPTNKLGIFGGRNNGPEPAPVEMTFYCCRVRGEEGTVPLPPTSVAWFAPNHGIVFQFNTFTSEVVTGIQRIISIS